MESARALIDADGSLMRYARAARKFPLLSAEIEQALSRRWRDHYDITAAHQLINSHMRLVVKLAMRYRGYGLSLDDLVGEGQLGLVRAIYRFDPDRGVRFATYAIWWIRAAVQEYVLRNWSLVRIGTTSSQKKLFFNLRRLRSRLQEIDDGPLKPAHVVRIADILKVPRQDVISMNDRMAAGPDCSLNAPSGVDDQSEWQDRLVDGREDQEAVLASQEEIAGRISLLPFALNELTTRERRIIAERHLRESPVTLRELSLRYGISAERVRQLEMRALRKLHNVMKE
jgi:RNA polymerase sigma-32 factor